MSYLVALYLWVFSLVSTPLAPCHASAVGSQDSCSQHLVAPTSPPNAPGGGTNKKVSVWKPAISNGL